MRIGFWTLLVAVIVVGLAIGGSFAGGMVLGRSQASEATPSGFARPFPTGAPRSGMGVGDDQFGFPGMGGRPLSTGTIEKVEGSRLTIATPSGSQTFTLAEGVTVQRLGTIPLNSLQAGDRVTLSGAQSDSSQVTFIMVVPASLSGRETSP